MSLSQIRVCKRMPYAIHVWHCLECNYATIFKVFVWTLAHKNSLPIIWFREGGLIGVIATIARVYSRGRKSLIVLSALSIGFGFMGQNVSSGGGLSDLLVLD